MTKKTETKDPATLDTLLENKEQTDKALAELADSYREKLRRLEAVIGRQQTAEPPQPKTSDVFELRIGKQFGTWFWRVVAFVVMFVLIWGAMALLKEPKANGKANAPVPLEIVAEHPGEPVEGFLHSVSPSIVTSTNEDEPVSLDVLPTQPAEATPEAAQGQRTRLFQRRS